MGYFIRKETYVTPLVAAATLTRRQTNTGESFSRGKNS